MKKTLLAVSIALAASALPTIASADDGLAYNVGAVTEYRYRGLSQSRLKPALQGGVDYTKGPFYLGAWASTIKWIKDAGTIGGVDTGSSNVEVDLYGGYKFELAKDVTLDVGGLYYWYPGNKLGDYAGLSNANTFEVYGALSYGIFTAKYSHSLTSLFGTGGNGTEKSKGSGYLDLSANFDLGNGFTLTPHLGRQEVRHYSLASYTDYSLTLGKDLGSGLSVSAALVGTDTKDIPANPNGYAYFSPSGKNLGRTTVVLGLKYGF